MGWFSYVTENVSSVMSSCKKTATDFVSNAKEKVPRMISSCKKTATDFVSNVKEKVPQMISYCKTAVTDVISFAKEYESYFNFGVKALRALEMIAREYDWAHIKKLSALNIGIAVMQA